MTAQAPDRLFIEGKELLVVERPPIPESHDELIWHPEDKIPPARNFVRTTACRRGYIAEWWIYENKIFLCTSSGRLEKKNSPPIIANWISGTVVAASGELIRYVHQGFSSVYEFEHFFKFQDGILIEKHQKTNEKPPALNEESGNNHWLNQLHLLDEFPSADEKKNPIKKNYILSHPQNLVHRKVRHEASLATATASLDTLKKNWHAIVGEKNSGLSEPVMYTGRAFGRLIIKIQNRNQSEVDHLKMVNIRNNYIEYSSFLKKINDISSFHKVDFIEFVESSDLTNI